MDRRALLFLVVFLLVSLGCGGRPPSGTFSATEGATAEDEFTELVGPLGRTYRVSVGGEDEGLPAGEDDLITAEFEAEVDRLEADDPLAAVQFTGDAFQGTCRKVAKITVAEDDDLDAFDSLDDLLAVMPDDDEMQALDIGTAVDSGRLEVEEDNTVVKAFILATNKPADNDYHVILGNDPDNPTTFMNVEVSGIPWFPRDEEIATQEDRDTLEAVRSFYQTQMGNLLPTSGTYKKFQPGIPVVVTGSLYYDACHSPGQVGTGSFKPESCWELHPVTFIEFVEPE